MTKILSRFERNKLMSVVDRVNPVAELDRVEENGDYVYKAKLEQENIIVGFIVPSRHTRVGRLREPLLDRELSKNISAHLRFKIHE